MFQDAKAIQDAKEYEELKQVKGGIYFRTRRLKKTAEEYSEAIEAYHKLQAGLVKEVVNIACEPFILLMGTTSDDLCIISHIYYGPQNTRHTYCSS